jgi:hypothetical protein
MKQSMLLMLALTLFGCNNVPFATNESALLDNGYVIASYPNGFEMDGIAGDKRLLFTNVVPSPGVGTHVTVTAASRLTGVPVGELPPPPSGWFAPTGVEVLSYATHGLGTSGELLVTDNGALPPNAHIVVYKYGYAYDPISGFSAHLVATYPLPMQPPPPISTISGFGFVSDLFTLSSGTSVLTDALVGAIWSCDMAFSCQLLMVDPDFGPAPASPINGVGRAQGGGTQPYTLVLTVGLSPGIVGVTYVAATDEVCTARTALAGGVFCIDRAQLLDTSVSPYSKTKRVVVPPQLGLSDGGHGVAADRWHPSSPWLYWVRSYSDAAGGGFNAVHRVNLLTLEVQNILQSNTLLDFSTGITVLPPLIDGPPFTNLAVPMGQEECNGALNQVLNGVNRYVSPTLITGVTTYSN